MASPSRLGIVCVLASMVMTTSDYAGESLVAGGTGAANEVARRLASGFLKGNPGSWVDEFWSSTTIRSIAALLRSSYPPPACVRRSSVTSIKVWLYSALRPVGMIRLKL